MTAMRVDAFDFVLPPERIALAPANPRDSARMLVVGPDGDLTDAHVRDLPDFLTPRDALVVNDTRVIAARLEGVRVRGEAIASPLTRTPSSRAAMTRVSFATSASRGVKKSGRSRTSASVRFPVGSTTSIRALSRGFAGESAMRSAGRTKSKASTRIAVIAVLWRSSIR